MTMNSDRDLRTVDAGVGEQVGAGIRSPSAAAILLSAAARRKTILIVAGGLIAVGAIYLFVVVLHKPWVPVVAGMGLAHLLMHRGGHSHGGNDVESESSDGTDNSSKKHH